MNMISQVEDKLLQAASGDKQHVIQKNVERCSMIQLRCFVLPGLSVLCVHPDGSRQYF